MAALLAGERTGEIDPARVIEEQSFSMSRTNSVIARASLLSGMAIPSTTIGDCVDMACLHRAHDVRTLRLILV